MFERAISVPKGVLWEFLPPLFFINAITTVKFLAFYSLRHDFAIKQIEEIPIIYMC